MTVNNRVEALGKLGSIISSQEWIDQVISPARAQNNWFTAETIHQSIQAISEAFLTKELLQEWISRYDISGLSPKKVGLVLAGNIPAVGFHDILCVLISGHIACIKTSSKDDVLIRAILQELIQLEPRFSNQVHYIERIEDIDAIIATGSNNTSMYFEHYFKKYPHIIRKNRKSVGVIYKDTTEEELRELASDILSYYGLGCRNVSKVFIHESVDKAKLMDIWHEFNSFILHHKYKNNYDYNYTVYLLNQEDFLMNGAFILRPHESLYSRIACLHYEHFKEEKEIEEKLYKQQDELQCIVSSKPLKSLMTIRPGEAQKPGLSDYADHVDTIDFLISI